MLDRISNDIVYVLNIETSQSRIGYSYLRIKSLNNDIYYHLYNSINQVIIHSNSNFQNSSFLNITSASYSNVSLTDNHTAASLVLTGNYQLTSSSGTPTDIVSQFSSTQGAFTP